MRSSSQEVAWHRRHRGSEMLAILVCRSQHGSKQTNTKIYEGKGYSDMIQFENHETTKGKADTICLLLSVLQVVV